MAPVLKSVYVQVLRRLAGTEAAGRGRARAEMKGGRREAEGGPRRGEGRGRRTAVPGTRRFLRRDSRC